MFVSEFMRITALFALAREDSINIKNVSVTQNKPSGVKKCIEGGNDYDSRDICKLESI